MFGLGLLQQHVNKHIAERNKQYIIKKLIQYYEATKSGSKVKAKEFAIYCYWQAKNQGRLDSLNRIKRT